MTELNRLFRAGIFAGVLLSTAAVAVGQSAPQNMPRPRYQSPGVPQAQQIAEPTPQFSLPVTPSITPNATVVEDIVVRVNDQIISRSDVQRAEEQLQQELASSRGNGGDPVERQKNLLRDLIDQQLLLSKGKELGLNPDAEVVRRMDEIRKQNNFPSMEALEAAIRQQGLSLEDFKANIRNNIVTSEVIRDEVGRSLSGKISGPALREYYEQHKADFAQPEQVRLSEILVPTAANADDTQIEAAQKSAQGIYDKLKGGADFAATAKSSSGGPTAAQGGDLGQFKHGALAQVLEDKTFPLPVGGFTEPIRTRQGYVILKVTEHQQAGSPPLEQVEGDVQNAMYQEAIQPALRAYLTKLREDAYLDVRQGFVDSGASTKQTKPVFAAYVPPAPKKKQVEKQRMDERKRAQVVAAATPATQELGKNGKPKKVKREKIRYGQAPRTALPEGTADGDAVNTATSAAAPGQAISPLQESSNTVAANAPDETDPTAPKAEKQKKTRYGSREVEVKQKKQNAQNAKVMEKVKATPIAATSGEKQDKTTQSSALGLNGSTADKKKKPKRQKGEAKERMQQKAVEKPAPLDDNGLPDRLHQVNGPAKPAADGSTAAGTSTKPTGDATQPAPTDKQ
ncbi:peptidyl-prolyl cis-trans isomerase [Terriglobus sp. TAA 43]|uniref:peptidylprolyl isomerase n=1 Tax=Terriglobus sp. TAA 43 TaxID=278961 RepID=UPI00068BAE3D|nr:peptidyl-prolyl cis-trans isomerase [Terriglobus sp. TAA 43]